MTSSNLVSTAAMRLSCRMVWSQLRKQVRELICVELQDRIDFHRSVYRKSHDGMYDRSWITLDGEQVLSYSHGEWTVKYLQARAEGGKVDFPHSGDLGIALHRYLEFDLQGNLASGDPIRRALAFVDRRMGRRTFARETLKADDTDLVKVFRDARQKVWM